MEATIQKSIGNTYEIQVNGNFYNLVTFKTACKYLEIDKIIPRLNSLLSNGHVEAIVINERKIKAEVKGYDDIINWTDKRRTVLDIINTFKPEYKLIKILAHKVKSIKGSPSGFTELETPEISYYLKMGKYELQVSKDVFYNETGSVVIEEKRAW